jgi:beta-aspartyl-peptidase (threonine type)
VLEDGRHVLLVADGAQAFALAAGIPGCVPEELVTERQRRRWEAGQPLVAEVESKGTVGAVALDRGGTAAAATSTGGLWGKLPGRVGDSALIGCGTYADNTLGAVSCTGDGEAIIRVTLARRTLDYLKDAGDPEYAAPVAVDLLVDEGRGGGGLIVVDWRGRTAYAHSTLFMPVAWMNPSLPLPHVPF